ncbi:MAG: chromosome segregation protein SMC [Lachnospiraceae bacterium]
MYLKSIEVQGFKSFANKIHFQFHNGITAIVGPNGSGKSNVADAVRWVLGEQKIKQLRGDSMQDVIFSGTQTRKPLSYAYVAITLDNSDKALAIDFSEVTVSRRLYRSGESEYCINGTVCRLKDIHELFYDTGIGKEGYSIIGQGQIEKILNGKPDERRELFDEAAGIVKFKRRKLASTKKLEEEKANLLRVKDILSELERQVGPLEKQANKAKIYLQKRDALKELDVHCFLLEHNKKKTDLEEMKEKVCVASKQLEEVTAKFHSIKDEYDQTALLIEKKEILIEQNRDFISEQSAVQGEIAANIAVTKEQIISMGSNESYYLERQLALEKGVISKDDEINTIQAGMHDLQGLLEQLSKERDRVQATFDTLKEEIQKLSLQLEQGKQELMNSLNERADYQAKIGKVDTLIEQKQIRKATIQSQLLMVESSVEDHEALVLSLSEEFATLCKSLKKLESQKTSNEEVLTAKKKELITLDTSLRNSTEAYHHESSKLDALKNITERYEGYGQSIKRVMEQKATNKGIIGVVADIIKTPKKYETAIETALGGDIQNIVTADEGTAKTMIQFLKQQKAGRATFRPLTSMRHAGSFKFEASLKEEGVIGLANTLVEIDTEYEDLAKSLLGRVLVVDHIDHAIKIAQKYHYSIRMVTIDGELLSAGGAMSGGAYKNNSNLLGRRRELDELEASVSAHTKERTKLEEAIKVARGTRDALRLEQEKLSKAIQETMILQNTKRLHLVTEEEKVEEVSNSKESLTEEYTKLEQEIAQSKIEAKEISENQKQLLDKEQFVKTHVAELEHSISLLKEEEFTISERFVQADSNVLRHTQSNDFQQENLDRITSEKENIEHELDDIVAKVSKNKEDISSKQAFILQLEESMLESKDRYVVVDSKLKAFIEEREALNQKQKIFFEERELVSMDMNRLDKEVFRLQSQKEKISESIDALIHYMWDEYEMTLSQVMALEQKESLDLSELKKEISNIKTQIKALGSINVNAVEEFKELQERYLFLKKQHDDLEEAEKILLEIIEELDVAMRKQFKEKFGQIREEFDKVFKELFGGGQGSLELADEEDLLEAGIRINAQPPGKKLQNMIQLSGGEKALTAIALLFAIQNLKPSPFCLLDEIEAALDESNVGRYAKYLHKLTTSTQFIVITHRRGTMEEADRLYGITMQEKGVSALVSVNLLEEELK